MRRVSVTLDFVTMQVLFQASPVEEIIDWKEIIMSNADPSQGNDESVLQGGDDVHFEGKFFSWLFRWLQNLHSYFFSIQQGSPVDAITASSPSQIFCYKIGDTHDKVNVRKLSNLEVFNGTNIWLLISLESWDIGTWGELRGWSA